MSWRMSAGESEAGAVRPTRMAESDPTQTCAIAPTIDEICESTLLLSICVATFLVFGCVLSQISWACRCGRGDEWHFGKDSAAIVRGRTAFCRQHRLLAG